MKKIIFIAALVYSGAAHAQVLNQDGEGKSSVVYEGGTVGVDFTKARLSFTYNNFGFSPAKKLYRENQLLWGFNASGENKEGVAGLFKRGDIVNQAQLNGFIGVKFKPERYTESQNATMHSAREALRDRKNEELDVVDERLETETDQARQAWYKEKKSKLEAEIAELEKQMKAYNEKQVRERISAYLKFGRTGLTFKQVVPATDPAGLSTEFATVNFGGNFVGIGINYEIGPFILGAYAENEKASTFSTLTKGTYTRTKKETVGAYTQESKEEVTAYTGDYKTYHRMNYYLDLILFQGLTEHNYIAWNIYYRYRDTKDKLVMPSYSDLGAGAYLFNKKNQFMGGFYVEASDLNQDLERAKKEPKIRQVKDRLTFGIVTKFSFASIGLPGI